MTARRTLHLITSDRWTGAAEPVANVVLGLRGRGHQVLLGIVRGRSLEAHVRDLGLDLVEGLHLSRHLRPLCHLSDLRTLARVVRSQRIELIHCHLSHDHWLAGWSRFIHRLPVPIIRTLHRVGSRGRGLGGRLLWNHFTDAAIILAESSRQEPPIRRIAPERVRLIRGGVDTARFHTGQSGAEVRRGLGIPCDAPVVGMIAHFKAGRGWHTAIPAFAAVHRRHPEAHFLLAGGHSRLVKWIRAQMQEAGALQHTHVLTDRRFAWPEVLAAMDLSVWLAPGSEGSARAVLEVMATGRPVIAGAVGVAPEIIEDGRSGVIVPKGVTSDQLADAVLNLIGNPQRRHALGQAARGVVEERFSLARQIDEIEGLYEDVLARQR